MSKKFLARKMAKILRSQPTQTNLDAKFRYQFTLLLLFLFSIFFHGSISIAGEVTFEDQQIIEAGIKKASELGLNPVPICGEEQNKWFIPGGFQVRFGQSGVAITDGDMVINATQGLFNVMGTALKRAEYARIVNGQAIKGDQPLMSQ